MNNKNDIIDSGILERFISTYWGYGDFTSPIWVVGMEESCGKSEFSKRINAWHSRGERQLEDAADYHSIIGHSGLFEPGAKIQRTWSKLIKAYLAAYGQRTDTGRTRQFQVETLGRKDSKPYKTCLIELMPLPSPSTKEILADAHSDLDYLQSRKDYLKKVAPDRVLSLKKLIDSFQPKAVLFYGLTYRKYWEQVSGVLYSDATHRKLLRCSGKVTEFFAMPHPVARGVRNSDYISFGEEIHRTISI